MIPKLHYISQGNTVEEHLENIQKACSSGAELVQLCLKNVAEDKILKLAKEVRETTAHYQTRLIINEHYKIAKEVKADGVHLDNLSSYTKARIHLYTWQIIGGTANTLKDCKKHIEEQVDYIMLSPFIQTIKDKKAPIALGLNGFTLIKEALQTKTPIIGFGGITTNDVAAILKTGVSGIAVSEEITKNFDAIKTFHQLLNASSTEELRHTF